MQPRLFDIFILSDTTDPDIWIEEESTFLALRRRTGADTQIFYRRRTQNTARKAGNIADWVTRFGGAYPQFLILDADSVMDGATLVLLVTAMEAHAPVGPDPDAADHHRRQHAVRAHAAIRRPGVRPADRAGHRLVAWRGGQLLGPQRADPHAGFRRAGGLPELPGRKPFGGHILSHDFVEAALMRRGGWAVHMVPALRGSYEERPPSMTDLAMRDRRWCQGNLQHAAVLPARGLHWLSRMHLLTGIGCYVTAPLWLLFLLAGILIALQARFVPPDYFPAGKSLFPQWPVIDPVRAMWVFVGTMALLLIPKLLGSVAVHAARPGAPRLRRHAAAVCQRAARDADCRPDRTGGDADAVVDVVDILLGRDAGWNVQRRDDGSVPLRVRSSLSAAHAAGSAAGGAAWAVSPSLALWMLPVVLGLALAIPLAVVTGQRRTGMALRRAGLLLIPEEVQPPPVLARAAALAFEFAGANSDIPPAVPRLLRDPALLEAHRRMLPPARQPRVDPIDPTVLVARVKLQEAETLAAGLQALTRSDVVAALGDAACLDRLEGLAGRE